MVNMSKMNRTVQTISFTLSQSGRYTVYFLYIFLLTIHILLVHKIPSCVCNPKSIISQSIVVHNIDNLLLIIAIK